MSRGCHILCRDVFLALFFPHRPRGQPVGCAGVVQEVARPWHPQDWRAAGPHAGPDYLQGTEQLIKTLCDGLPSSSHSGEWVSQ